MLIDLEIITRGILSKAKSLPEDQQRAFLKDAWETINPMVDKKQSNHISIFTIKHLAEEDSLWSAQTPPNY